MDILRQSCCSTCAVGIHTPEHLLENTLFSISTDRCNSIMASFSSILFAVLLTHIVQSQQRLIMSEQPNYGWCGTRPTDTFTFLEDAERPFCLKFKNAVTEDGDPHIVYYYFGTRVDRYTYVTLQHCTCYFSFVMLTVYTVR